MEIGSITEQMRKLVEAQLRIAGDDPAMAAAGEILLSAIEPAMQQAAMSLAEQAGREIAAQLPERDVDVVLADGQPTLIVRQSDGPATVSTEDLDARMTVRLPEELKDDLEIAASELGDSVNTFVVKALAGSSAALKRSSRSTFKGTIET